MFADSVYDTLYNYTTLLVTYIIIMTFCDWDLQIIILGNVNM